MEELIKKIELAKADVAHERSLRNPDTEMVRYRDGYLHGLQETLKILNMKKYLIRTEFNRYRILAERGWDISYSKIDDDFFEFVTEGKEPVYSNETEEHCSKKDDKKITEILGEIIMNDFDFKRFYADVEMIEIYTLD